MPIETWEPIVGASAAIAGAVGGGFWNRRSRAEREAAAQKARAEAAERDAAAALATAEAEVARSKSAVELARGYQILVDSHQESLNDARAHIHRQDDELRSLREEITRVREARDEELTAVRTELAATRQELAAVRQELADERNEKNGLRDRVALLEARDAA